MRPSTRILIRSYVRHPFRPTFIKLARGPRTRLVQRVCLDWRLHRRPRGRVALYFLIGRRRRALLEQLGRRFA